MRIYRLPLSDTLVEQLIDVKLLPDADPVDLDALGRVAAETLRRLAEKKTHNL